MIKLFFEYRSTGWRAYNKEPGDLLYDRFKKYEDLKKTIKKDGFKCRNRKWQKTF